MGRRRRRLSNHPPLGNSPGGNPGDSPGVHFGNSPGVNFVNSPGVKKPMLPRFQVLDNRRQLRRADAASRGGVEGGGGVGERVEIEGVGAAGAIKARVEEACDQARVGGGGWTVRGL